MAEGDTGLSGMGGLCLCVWVFGVESLCWVGASRVGLADMLGMAVPCLAWLCHAWLGSTMVLVSAGWG